MGGSEVIRVGRRLVLLSVLVVILVAGAVPAPAEGQSRPPDPQPRPPTYADTSITPECVMWVEDGIRRRNLGCGPIDTINSLAEGKVGVSFSGGPVRPGASINVTWSPDGRPCDPGEQAVGCYVRSNGGAIYSCVTVLNDDPTDLAGCPGYAFPPGALPSSGNHPPLVERSGPCTEQLADPHREKRCGLQFPEFPDGSEIDGLWGQTYYMVYARADLCFASGANSVNCSHPIDGFAWLPVHGLLGPSARFEYETTPIQGQVSFINSSDPFRDQGAVYRWVLGDGTISDEVHPLHTYAAAGEYEVTLILRGEDGTDCGPPCQFTMTISTDAARPTDTTLATPGTSPDPTVAPPATTPEAVGEGDDDGEMSLWVWLLGGAAAVGAAAGVKKFVDGKGESEEDIGGGGGGEAEESEAEDDEPTVEERMEEFDSAEERARRG